MHIRAVMRIDIIEREQGTSALNTNGSGAPSQNQPCPRVQTTPSAIRGEGRRLDSHIQDQTKDSGRPHLEGEKSKFKSKSQPIHTIKAQPSRFWVDDPYGYTKGGNFLYAPPECGRYGIRAGDRNARECTKPRTQERADFIQVGDGMSDPRL